MATLRSLSFRIVLLILLPLAHSRGNVKTLTEDTWKEMLKGEWMVEFFAPWCPACRQLESIWENFAGWSDDLGIKVGSVDVTTNPGLSGRFAITALPTIYHVKDGVFRQYRGSKRKDDLISFIEDAKWNTVEPIPSWKSPQSIQMTSLAYFFKFSMFLRNVHNDLVELGIPYWGSYIIFGLATIFLGAVLGLFIVYIIDHVFPARKPQHSTILPDHGLKGKKEGIDRHADEIACIPEESDERKEVETGDDKDESSPSDSDEKHPFEDHRSDSGDSTEEDNIPDVELNTRRRRKC